MPAPILYLLPSVLSPFHLGWGRFLNFSLGPQTSEPLRALLTPSRRAPFCTWLHKIGMPCCPWQGARCCFASGCFPSRGPLAQGSAEPGSLVLCEELSPLLWFFRAANEVQPSPEWERYHVGPAHPAVSPQGHGAGPVCLPATHSCVTAIHSISSYDSCSIMGFHFSQVVDAAVCPHLVLPGVALRPWSQPWQGQGEQVLPSPLHRVHRLRE